MGEEIRFDINIGEEFKNWYRLYYPMVRRLVIENGGSKEDAEDVFQETLIVLYEKKRTNQYILTSKESTFIHSIALNKWRDYSRKRNRNFSKTNDIDLSVLEIADETLISNRKDSYSEKLRSCIEKLSETRKMIICEYYYSKLSMKEIAEKFGLENDDSVKSQKYKAIMDLKKCKELITD